MSDIAKHNAAAAALEMVEPGMMLGLGTGSTAAIFVKLLSEKVKAGFDIAGTPTSEATERLARSLGIRIFDPNEVSQIDLTIDGADEFDPELNLIKGGGAALLREKIIADASDRMVVITDVSKEVQKLGRFPLPVEVNPFAHELTRREILGMMHIVGLPDIEATWRMAAGEAMLRTDGGHLILDLKCGVIDDPRLMAAILDRMPGVVEHGLFIGLADTVIIGEDEGVRVLNR